MRRINNRGKSIGNQKRSGILMIPKIIHQIWIGETPPDFIQEAMDNLRDMNPDFEYMRWGNEAIQEFNLEKEAQLAKYPAFMANIIRLRALEKYGGIYVDADTECLQSLNDWFQLYQKYPLYSNFINDVFPDMAIIIAKPGIDYYMAEVDYDLQGPMGFYWQRMRPHIIPESEVGKNGTILKDLRLNSWVKK